MKCPVCGCDSAVICSRRDCESVCRRRKCLQCGHLFFTTELELPSSKKDFRILDADLKQKNYTRKKQTSEDKK